MSSQRTAVVRHTVSVAVATTLSKALGFIRELLLIRYLGVTAIGDAFTVAFRIPNSLRKIFAEGALSAAFVPSIVTTTHRKGVRAASEVVSAGALIIQALIIPLCILIGVFAPSILCALAPGWCSSASGAERLALAVSLVRVLIGFISAISLSSLLAGALQAVHIYTVPAFAQVLMNVLLCIQLMALSWAGLPAWYLAWCILFNGLIMVLFHGYFYLRAGFVLTFPDRSAWASMRAVLLRFFHCCAGGGAMEINAFIDQMIASYLPAGAIMLINSTAGFIRIPIGILAVPFSNIMLTKFSKVVLYAPERLGYYLFEGARCMLWCAIPATLGLSLFAYRIFYIFMQSSNFTLDHVYQAQILLIIGSLTIFWTSYNKILESALYALHETSLPTIATVLSVVVNVVLSLLLLPIAGAPGIVAATVIATAVRTVALLVMIHKYLGLPWYGHALARFIRRFVMQIACIGWVVYGLYLMIYAGMERVPQPLSQWLCWGFGYWLWVAPLCACAGWLLYATRTWFKTKTYFL